MPDLSVIIVSYNTRDILRRCLDALADAGAELTLQVIVVDNGSSDGSVEHVASRLELTLIANTHNAGFAAANNQGLAVAQAPVALLLNSDAFVDRAALAEGLALLRERPEVGIAGVRLVNADGSPQAEHGRFPSLWSDVRASAGLDRLRHAASAPLTAPAPVDWVQGACMFVRMAALADIGGLDTRFFMYSEEVEWCQRCWHHGWQVWQLPGASVVHWAERRQLASTCVGAQRCIADGWGCGAESRSGGERRPVVVHAGESRAAHCWPRRGTRHDGPRSWAGDASEGLGTPQGHRAHGPIRAWAVV